MFIKKVTMHSIKGFIWAISSILSMVGSIFSWGIRIPFDNTVSIENAKLRRAQIISHATLREMIDNYGWDELIELSTPLEMREKLHSEIKASIKQNNLNGFYENYEKNFSEFLDHGIFLPAEIELMRDVKKYNDKLGSILDHQINNFPKTRTEAQNKIFQNLIDCKTDLKDEIIYSYTVLLKDLMPLNDSNILDINLKNYSRNLASDLVNQRKGRRNDSNLTRKRIKDLGLLNFGGNEILSKYTGQLDSLRKKRDEYDDGLSDSMRPVSNRPNTASSNFISDSIGKFKRIYWDYIDSHLQPYFELLKPLDYTKTFDDTLDDSHLRIKPFFNTRKPDTSFFKNNRNEVKDYDLFFSNDKNPFYKEQLFPEEDIPGYVAPEKKMWRPKRTDFRGLLEDLMEKKEELRKQGFDVDNLTDEQIEEHLGDQIQKIWEEMVNPRNSDGNVQTKYEFNQVEGVDLEAIPAIRPPPTLDNFDNLYESARKISKGELYSILSLDEKQHGPPVYPEGSFLVQVHSLETGSSNRYLHDHFLRLAKSRFKFQNRKKIIESLPKEQIHFRARSREEKVEYINTYFGN